VPVLRALSLCTCRRHYPCAAARRIPRSSHPAVSAFRGRGRRVGLHIDLFEIPWRVGGSDRFPGQVKGLLPPILELTMNITTDQPEAPTAIRTDLGAIFVSLELSRSSWLITSLSPGGGEKMSKHTVRGGDVSGLLQGR
jgi:hypothetical protein